MSNQQQQEKEQPFRHPNKHTAKKLAWIVFGISSLFCVLLIALLFADE